jgi:hypothetical protein
MRSLAISILLLTAAATWECSTDSTIPLGTPSAESFDRRLLGPWGCITGDDPTEGGPASVYAFNDREYYILIGTEDGQEHLRAFSTTVDGSRFLNIQFLRFESPGAYTIVGYAFDSPTSVTLRVVDLGPEEAKPRTETALAAFIRRRLAEGSLYDDDVFVCKRDTTKEP